MISLEYIPKDKAVDCVILKEWFQKLQVDFLIIPDSPKMKPTPEASILSILLQRYFEVDVIPSIAASGRKEERIESLLLGLKYAGIQKVAVVGGDYRKQDDLNGAQIAKKAKEILGEESFIICGSNLVLDKKNKKSLEDKINNGAGMIISQPVFDAQDAERFLKDVADVTQGGSIKIALSFFPIYNPVLCEKICADNLGFNIPHSYREKIQKTALKTNIELYATLKEKCSHIHICGANNAFISHFIKSIEERGLEI